MSARLPCPPAPGPFEAFALRCDILFHTLAQRHGFRTYLPGLLMPRDRSKNLTALVGAESLVRAQTAEVQRLQLFVSAENRSQELGVVAEEPTSDSRRSRFAYNFANLAGTESCIKQYRGGG